jgi:CubicO group peptidase (beta-lactamase class C family)
VARTDLQRILDGLVTGPADRSRRDRLRCWPARYLAGLAGVADVNTGEPICPDTRTRLDSISKWWATAVILQLAQEGKPRLGDTVQHWLPGLLPGSRYHHSNIGWNIVGLIAARVAGKPLPVLYREQIQATGRHVGLNGGPRRTRRTVEQS